jgi:hypothetical protein
MAISDYIALPVLALQTALGVMLITVAASMYGTGLPLINVALLVVVAIIWMSSTGTGSSGMEEEDLGPITWSAATIGALVTLAYGGTFILFRAGTVYMQGTLFTTVGDTLLLSAILVALRVYFVR